MGLMGFLMVEEGMILLYQALCIHVKRKNLTERRLMVELFSVVSVELSRVYFLILDTKYFKFMYFVRRIAKDFMGQSVIIEISSPNDICRSNA